MSEREACLLVAGGSFDEVCSPIVLDDTAESALEKLAEYFWTELASRRPGTDFCTRISIEQKKRL